MGRVGGTVARPGTAELPWALAGLAAAAWVAIAAWGASPQARWLDHAWAPEDAAGQLLAAGAFAAGWTLMVTAMMLPSAGALLAGFGRAVRRRPDRRPLGLLVAAGFLGTWMAVGFAFRGFDVGVHAVVDELAVLGAHPQILAGGTLVLAGAFQFTELKRRCLVRCRAPEGFIYRHWGAGRPWRDAVAVGSAYGRSCAGCCWALMLVMFAVGMANLAWMLVIAGLTAAEKAGLAGPRLVHGAGAALIVAGVAVAAG